MKRTLLALSIFAATGGVALAADPMMVSPVEMSVSSGAYIQLLGGAALPGTIDYNNSGEYDMDAGYAVAGTVGYRFMDGLSGELDVLHLSRTMSDFDYYHVSTTSVMANLKYTVDLNDTFGVYGALGVGYIFGTDTDDLNDFVEESGGAGYQVIVGVSANVTENVALLAEYRFQNTFSGLAYDGTFADDTLDTPTSIVLVGAKLGF